MQGKTYRFVAYPTWSLAQPEGQPRQTVELAIRPNDDVATAYFKDVWQKLSLSVKNFYKLHCIPSECPGWVGWQPHEWSIAKRGVEDRIKFIAWDGQSMAGLLNLRPDFHSGFTPETRVMYVEHMAAAPGNLKAEIWERRLAHIGQALLAYACYESLNRGYNGLIGLHAADDTALSYYQKINVDFDNLLFNEPITGVPAPYPIGEKGQEKPYFETTVNGAAALLDSYCDD